MNPGFGVTTTQAIMRALRDEYPRDPLLARMPDGLQQEIADSNNSTRKYVASCVSCRRGLASPAGQHLLSAYKSIGDWNMAWTDTMVRYPKMLPPSKIHDYKTMAMADPVFSRGLSSSRWR